MKCSGVFCYQILLHICYAVSLARQTTFSTGEPKVTPVCFRMLSTESCFVSGCFTLSCFVLCYIVLSNFARIQATPCAQNVD